MPRQGAHHLAPHVGHLAGDREREVAHQRGDAAVRLEERREPAAGEGIEARVRAPLLGVGGKRRGERRLLAQAVGEHGRIDQGEVGALAELRAGDAAGVADEDDALGVAVAQRDVGVGGERQVVGGADLLDERLRLRARPRAPAPASARCRPRARRRDRARAGSRTGRRGGAGRPGGGPRGGCRPSGGSRRRPAPAGPDTASRRASRRCPTGRHRDRGG